MDLREYAKSERSARDGRLQIHRYRRFPSGVRFSIEHGGATFSVQSVAKPRHYPFRWGSTGQRSPHTGAVMAGWHLWE